MHSFTTFLSSLFRTSATCTGIQSTPIVDTEPRHTIRQTAAETIKSFVIDLECDLSPFPVADNPELLDAAINECYQHVSSEYYRQELIKRLPVGVILAIQCYKDQPFEIQLLIGLYTVAFGYIDDADPESMKPKLNQFAANFGKGAAQGDPCLDYLAYLIRVEIPKFWGPFTSSCIVKSTLDMVTGNMLENRFPSGFDQLAQNFPAFVRRKTGNSEAYVLFNFPECLFPEEQTLGLYIHSLPGAMDICDFVNDIMSYYKESILEHEDKNYIAKEARRQQRPSIEVLVETCQRTCAIHKQLRQKLAEADEQVLQAYLSFVDGMAAYHVIMSRYHLRELGLAIENGKLTTDAQMSN